MVRESLEDRRISSILSLWVKCTPNDGENGTQLDEKVWLKL